MILNPKDISPDGIRRIAGFEWTVLHLYKDVAGIETVCTGHVTLPGEDWSDVTPEKCQAALGRDLRRFVACVLSKLKAPYTQEMLDAAVCLAFNIGCGGFQSSSVLSLWNALDFEGAAQAFKLWAFAKVKQKDGSFLKRPVLLGRRNAEADLFLVGVSALRGELPTWAPTIEESIVVATGTLFDLSRTIHDGPAGLSEEERRAPEDFIADDGRIVVVPPEFEEQLAA